jgi:hypothetical protein
MVVQVPLPYKRKNFNNENKPKQYRKQLVRGIIPQPECSQAEDSANQ